MSDLGDRALADLLALLDEDRRGSGIPDGPLVREEAADGASARVVAAGLEHLTPAEVDGLVGAEAARAAARGQELEWKVYAHDRAPGLVEALLRHGFEPDDVETVLGLRLDPPVVAVVPRVAVEVRRVVDADGLDDVAAVARDVGRRDVDAERHRLAAVLRQDPDTMTVHVAYLDGLPVATGRAHYRPGGAAVELAGGRTRASYRRRGLFTTLVACRLEEALARGRSAALVDALPTSEPVLTRLGFRALTRTRPYVRPPSG